MVTRRSKFQLTRTYFQELLLSALPQNTSEILNLHLQVRNIESHTMTATTTSSCESDDNYDVYYDEMDSPTDIESVTTIVTEPSFYAGRSCFEKLSVDVILGNILPYILQKKMLATIATVSKHFKEILFSPEAESLWNDSQSSFHLCIDTYCTSCLMKKLQKKGSHYGSIRFLRKFPIGRLKLHCFITDIPDCMLALSERKYLKALDLTLTNKSNSPPLEDLLGMASFFPLDGRASYNSSSDDSCTVSSSSSHLFPDLRELVLDSSHLQHVNLPGRARLLDILGSNLESLTFSGLSPAGNNDVTPSNRFKVFFSPY